jgi:hypothetical protein
MDNGKILIARTADGQREVILSPNPPMLIV